MEQLGATGSGDAAALDEAAPTHSVLVDPIPPHQLSGSEAAAAHTRNHNRLRGGFVACTERLNAASLHSLHCTNNAPRVCASLRRLTQHKTEFAGKRGR